MRDQAVIPLQTQLQAKHPTTGLPVTIIGVDTSASSLTPQLVVLHRGPKGIYAETIDWADEAPL